MTCGSHYLDINRGDEDDSSPLVLAIKNKRKDFIKYLLASVPQTNVNKLSKKYGHPLHLAIKTHEFKMALKFLKGWSGANSHMGNQ